MPAEGDENLHSDMDRVLEAIIQAKLLYAVTPRVPEYMKTILIIRPKSHPRGYSLLVKETYEAYRRSRI